MSYPLNFGIYCGMSMQFRDTFKQLIPLMCRHNSSNYGGIHTAVSKGKGPAGGHRCLKNQLNAGTGNQVKYI